MRLIETFNPTPHLVPKNQLPVPCIVEDSDGYRILVVANDTLAPGHQATAEQSGVVMTVRLDKGVAETHRGYVTVEGVPRYREVDEHFTALEAKLEAQRRLQGFVHLHTHSEFSSLDGF